MAVGSSPRAAGSAPPGVLPEYPKDPPKRDPSVTHMAENPPGPERTTVVHSPRRSAIATLAPKDSSCRSKPRHAFPAFSLAPGLSIEAVCVQLAYAGSPPPSTGTARIAKAAAAAAPARNNRRFLRGRPGIGASSLRTPRPKDPFEVTLRAPLVKRGTGGRSIEGPEQCVRLFVSHHDDGVLPRTGCGVADDAGRWSSSSRSARRARLSLSR